MTVEQGQRRSPEARDVFIFDGECWFCMNWLRRIRRWTGASGAEFRPFQLAHRDYPSIPLQEFERAFHWIPAEGPVLKGAEAIFALAARGDRSRHPFAGWIADALGSDAVGAHFAALSTNLPAVAAFASPERAALRMSRISAVGSAVGRPALAQQVDERFTALCARLTDVIRPLHDRGILRADLDVYTFCAWFAAVTRRPVSIGAHCIGSSNFSAASPCWA